LLTVTNEWHEAPGVRDPVLARTWARLEIACANGESPPTILTRCENWNSRGLHEGVYGSAFPLADWIVENWWFLQCEASRFPPKVLRRGGRFLGQSLDGRAWVHRHNLLAAREGMSLPDVSIYREGAFISLGAALDPEPGGMGTRHPVRFTHNGEVRLPAAEAQAALASFVERVVERLAPLNDDDSARLRSNWSAIVAADSDEQNLCRTAATIGVDPYCADEMTDSLIATIETRLATLSRGLRSDLLDATSADQIDRHLEWLEDAFNRTGLARDSTALDLELSSGARPAFAVGYDIARRFRDRCSIPVGPIDDLAGVLRRGWADVREVDYPDGVSGLESLVGANGHGGPTIIGRRKLRPDSQRFRLARAVCFLADRPTQAGPRLVTRANSWDQRVTRAFAAELLAPADALREEWNRARDIDELAQMFNVGARVVEHQLENWGLTSDDW
jgi:hypothetical protein